MPLFTLVGLVVANMVGTGVFTSLGHQLSVLRPGWVLLALWGIGGLCALCGALSYAELGAAFHKSGGEYTFLSRIYSRPMGFLAGWVSLTAGFAAPVALAAMALGSYASRLWPALHPMVAAQGVLVATTLLHLLRPKAGMAFQNGFTALKVGIILCLIGAGLLCAPHGDTSFQVRAADAHLVFSPPFAISLVFVMYAYSGWNASTYIASELKDPARDLPRSLILGTLIVMALYLGLNWVFLRSTPANLMAGKTEVGLIAATQILGPRLGAWMGGAIALLLISTISAMIWIGPRVIQVMGEDHPFFSWLATSTRDGVPAWAMALQSGASMILLWTGAYDRILIYAQFSLLLCTLLSALGVVVLRFTEPDLPRPYRAWGYPATPIAFSAVTLWMIIYVVMNRPVESLLGVATLLGGLLAYSVSQRLLPAPDRVDVKDSTQPR